MHLLKISFFCSISPILAQDKLPEPKAVDVSHLIVDNNLEVTLWAQTPQFYNPTNMDMDAYGRMWVAEGVNYRKHSKRRPKGDRIMVIQDTDHDGKADTSHVFVQEPGLISPLGVSVFGNKIVVSQPPELIVYTDVDNNHKYDPKIDKREVILTGFNGKNHDHSLHSVIGGPDGKWYINQGNCGALFTDKSGKTFRIGSSYTGGYNPRYWPNNPYSFAGKKSDDGYVWLGGFIARMNPDATQAEVVGHNMRNSYEHSVNSLGEIFQSDNDDPPACRNSFVLEYSSAGFSSADGLFSWEAERRPGQSIPTAHWRQESPGFMESGDVYGSGSPTGNTFYENGILGKDYEGTFLAADAGRHDIMKYKPTPNGANYHMNRESFLTVDKKKGSELFRPSDVEIGPDGAIYVSDWYDPRVGGHADRDDSLSGAIYRIAPKGYETKAQKVDFATIDGQIALLRSPSDNVRFLGFQLLKKRGAEALPAVKMLISDDNKWISARGIWLLPHLDNAGLEYCESLLSGQNEAHRLVAYKALRRADKPILSYATKLASDPSPRVRREVITSLRTLPYAEKSDLIISLYKGWDGKDKTYLEALGLAVTNQESQLWSDLRKTEAETATQWSDKFAKLTWRLHPAESIAELKQRASEKSLTEPERRLAIDTVAFIEGKAAPQAMLDIYLAKGPDAEYAKMWLGMNLDGKKWDNLIDRDLVAEKAGVVKPSKPSPMPHMAAPKERNTPALKAVLALKGDAEKGKVVAARCASCHEIGDTGVNYGPGLTGWGANRSKEQIAKAILEPNTDIAHGYEGSSVLLKAGGQIDGLVKSGKERAWHFVNNKNADAFLVITTMGGTQQKISWRYIKQVKPLKRTLMFYPEQLGLTNAQDVADLIEYLQNLK